MDLSHPSALSVATLVSGVAEDDRHTKRHSRRGKVAMTVTVDPPVFGYAAEPVAAFAPRPRPPTAPIGALIHVSVERAEAYEKAGFAVRVKTAKLGRAQRDLLVHLYHRTLAIEEERQDLTQRFAGVSAFKRRAPITRVPWSSKAAMDALGRSVTASAVSQVLQGLERRGLVFRERGAGGVQPRTAAVQLTDAGRQLAEMLMPLGAAETLNITAQ